ncbi:flagellar motor switch phosphatase FliY [Vagococcus sp. DIV0080]|uniref:Flagellar motor switch phosphatase FliY n=1 Tax=Candidatus Vagococcus giribetii TaxID=2230876 RepID=A0ABS3HT78_9ENTE|nr:flagellar motor switch phosphatase FliY [Vagococcus sp. DIV0080]MBO0476952.1 flagellar motor switch phosphatase FliY [Vagococcus sp. DIV0080]
MTENKVENMITNEAPTLMEPEIIRLMGEFGKVTMGQCMTTLSSILDKDIRISPPRVEHIPFREIVSDLSTPKVSAVVEFKEGLKGSSMMLLNVPDAVIIADLMTGGNGEPINSNFTEMELSAVGEAINQMTGSAVTSVATMIGQKVDIFQPKVTLWEDEADVDYKEIGLDTNVSRITFDFSVPGLIESEISQIFTIEMMEEVAQLMLQQAEEVTEGSDDMTENMMEETKNKKERTRKQKTRKVSIQQPEFDELADNKVESNIDNLDLLMDVPLDFSVVLGGSRKSIKEILTLGVGSVVELDRLTDEPLDIFVNSKLIAQGEVVVINENFGIRITSILSQKQRMNKLN